MATARHEQTLSRYLRNHKNDQTSNERRSEISGKKRTEKKSSWDSNTTPNKSSDTTRNGKKCVKFRATPHLGRAVTIDDLPDEILLKIFGYFLPGELMIFGLVCRRWCHLANDNLLWHRIYQKFVSGKFRRDRDLASEGNVKFWRSRCIKRCSEMRNLQKILTRKKINQFSGLLAGTEDSLKKMGTKWIIEFVNQHNEEMTVITNDDVCHFAMATNVRWFCLPALKLNEIVKMKVYAANPIFFDPHGLALPNSPCLRSLLCEFPFKWNLIKSQTSVFASDDSNSIDLYALGGGLLVAAWKDDGGLAFFSLSFHHHMLLERCLQGTHACPFQIPSHVKRGQDIDPRLGLHSYSCSLELRNHRCSFWKEQFLNVHSREDEARGSHVHFRLIHPERDHERGRLGKRLSLLWKTIALKGVVKDVCFLDLSVLSEGSEPMWCTSSPVKLTSASGETVNYTYVGQNQVIQWEDEKGKIDMLLIWDDDDQEYFITDLQLSISLRFINQWFATNY
ncbi:hypothetical protein CAPTEDRAFT_199995 [Capitella teleta]|uniref:F-box domain-containing protein n=1 Tax=Capitella teleta TaxID=283909 RepID=R7TEG7_CAPTE|nr:hypothetical protein CAPTEDRAFT_199995 [Capitella teleta]|eukprot:ELT92124.1 hypothetical protein CAPTEDRAFT_199995 [Capitella teleta]